MKNLKEHLEAYKGQLEIDWGLTKPIDAYEQGFIDATNLASKNFDKFIMGPGMVKRVENSILKAIEE